jgi:hypothetical protein
MELYATDKYLRTNGATLATWLVEVLENRFNLHLTGHAVFLAQV